MLCKQIGMDQVESDLAKLLKGDALDENDSLCDFTVADQNEASVAKGVTPLTPSDVVPVTKRTVNYVVLAILINENEEVLMMQEAKSSCAGQWYLPAGGVEPNENLEEAVKREVLEETGLEMEPSTLLMVECASNSWFRFIFTGSVTGGSLKTPAQADCHSLQAKWVSDIEGLSLRAKDVRYVLEVGRMYRTAIKQGQPYFSPTKIAINPHKKLLLRLVICVRQRSNNRVHVLLSEKNRLHFPMCEINGHRNLHSTLRKFMIEIFGASPQPHKPHGILSIEHCGRPEAAHDGFCLTILVSFRVPQEQVFPIDKYTWVMVSEELGESLLSKLPRNMSIPLNVIC